MLSQLLLGGAIVLSSVLAAVAALALVAGFTRPRPALRDAGGFDNRVIFLFQGRELIDSTEQGRDVLAGSAPASTDLDRLCATLAPMFPDLARTLDDADDSGDLRISAADGSPLRITARRYGAALRVEMLSEGAGADSPEIVALREECGLLRNVAAHAPVLAWRYDAEGQIDWTNGTYLKQVAQNLGVALGDLTWPPPDLMPQGSDPEPGGTRRVRTADSRSGRVSWYERHAAETAGGTIHYATPADALVKAEQALREFVQTLTKTFAQLPIGLAIFDRHRQLALFNPALIDLTTLPVEFLSARPALASFFDALREARMIPEPKDYPSWRQTMADLESAAAQGSYEETWPLPTGQTYHVTGRPHPDGAVAFLFEDISAEMSLTRRFRSEVELGLDVIDRIDDAIAVFSPAGILEITNTAYVRLWGSNPGRSFATTTVEDTVRIWKARINGGPSEDQLADGLREASDKTRQMSIELVDGRRLDLRFMTLTGGGHMAIFAERERPVSARPMASGHAGQATRTVIAAK